MQAEQSLSELHVNSSDLSSSGLQSCIWGCLVHSFKFSAFLRLGQDRTVPVPGSIVPIPSPSKAVRLLGL